MAMTYQNFASLGVNLNRQKYGPLDISNVFTSAADLQYYLTKGAVTEGVSEYWYKSADEKVVPYPYEGQVLATVIDGVVNVYALALDAEGNFTTQEIGAKVEADGTTIKVNAEGKLELVGLPETTTGKTFVPSLVNGVLTWAEPDTSTAEGQAQEIEGLKTRATALETTINGKAESSEGAGDGVVGLVDKVAALEAVDNATQAELDAYKTEVSDAISAALQSAKDYADAQDADTIYDDTALAGRVKAIEDDYLKTADKYDDTEVRDLISDLDEAIGDSEGGLVKDVADNATAIATEKSRAEAAEEALSKRIDAIDFVDPDELATAVSAGVTEAKGYTDEQIEAVNDAISKLNHFTTKIVTSVDDVTETGVLYLIKDESVPGVDKYNEYIVVDGAPVLIGDTTTDLSNYYNKTEVDGKVEALEGSIADEVEAREALAEKVTALEEVDNATQEELDAYKTEVTNAIATAKSEAIADADGKLANKVNTSDFETFKSDNTTAIATAKQEAIDAAAAAEEAKGYAVATEVEATYATKTALTEAVEGIENDLLAYAKTEDVTKTLEDYAKSEDVYTKTQVDNLIGTPGSPAEGEEGQEGYVPAVPGTGVYQHVYSKDEVTDLIADITGGESAADVLAALNAYKTTNDTRVKAVEDKNGEQDTAIAAAQTQADKGVSDAAQVATDLAALDARVVNNANEIATVKGSITTVNETLSGKISNLEAKDTEFAGLISGIDTSVKSHSTTIGEHTTAITALQNKDTEIAASIAANTKKFEDYSTTQEMNTAIADAIAAIPATDLSEYAKTADVNDALALKANAADVYTKDEADLAFMTEGEVDARINALIVAADPEGGKTITDIQNLVKYVDENAGDIAALVTATDANTAKLEGINTTVKSYVDNSIAALIMPKASTEVTIADDGTLGLGKVSTDKLVMGSNTLVIDGGDATV